MWKTYEQLRLLHKMNYDAVALGQNDLCPALADSAAKWRAREWLFSSFPAAQTRANVPPSRIVKKSDFKLGVVSAISPALQRAANTGSAQDVPAFLHEQLEHLKKQKADFLAVVYLGPPHELLALSKKFPEVDLWLQANGNHRPQNLIESANHALVVSAGDRGREIALITITKEKGGSRTAANFNQFILTDRIADAPRAKSWIENYRKAGHRGAQAPQKIGAVRGLHPPLGFSDKPRRGFFEQKTNAHFRAASD